jgi:hypothetical protein
MATSMSQGLCDYTIYTPEKEMRNQLEKEFCVNRVEEKLGVTYELGVVIFKPLLVFNKVFDLTLRTELQESPDGKMVKKKYLFSVRRHDDNTICLNDIPVKEIDEKIKMIYSIAQLPDDKI